MSALFTGQRAFEDGFEPLIQGFSIAGTALQELHHLVGGWAQIVSATIATIKQQGRIIVEFPYGECTLSSQRPLPMSCRRVQWKPSRIR